MISWPGGGWKEGYTLEGSFSIVSTPIFAIKYSLVTRRSAKRGKVEAGASDERS